MGRRSTVTCMSWRPDAEESPDAVCRSLGVRLLCFAATFATCLSYGGAGVASLAQDVARHAANVLLMARRALPVRPVVRWRLSRRVCAARLSFGTAAVAECSLDEPQSDGASPPCILTA